VDIKTGAVAVGLVGVVPHCRDERGRQCHGLCLRNALCGQNIIINAVLDDDVNVYTYEGSRICRSVPRSL